LFAGGRRWDSGAILAARGTLPVVVSQSDTADRKVATTPISIDCSKLRRVVQV